MNWKNLVAVAAFFCITGGIASAQQQFRKVTIPLAGTTVLSEVKDTFNAQVISLEAPEVDGEDSGDQLDSLKREVNKKFPHKTSYRANKGTAITGPLVVTGFNSDSLGGIPSDNYMAINNNDSIINVLNSNISVIDATTGQMKLRKSLYNFSVAVGLINSVGNQHNNRYDPKVIYDPVANKYICVILNGVNEYSHIIVGFSQTANPSGAWNFYKFVGNYSGDTSWFDYPTIALTQNEFFVTGNKLVYNGSFQTGFRYSVIYQIRKSDGYAGLPLTSQIWDNVSYGGRPIRNIFPVKGGGSIKGPEQYFLSVRNMDFQNDSVFLMRIGDTIGAPGNTVSVLPLTANINYGFPPNGRQPDTTYKLQTNDGRVLGAFIENNEIQFTTASVYTATGNSAIYHGVISNVTASLPTVQANFIQVDTLDFGFPNLSFTGSVSGKNTSIITFDYAGPNTFPGFGAVFFDGTSYSDMLKLKQGDSTIVYAIGALQRWGDYTGSQPQWNRIGSVWAVGMYGKKNHTYGNWIAHLRSPLATAVTQPTAILPGARIYPNPAFQYIKIDFELQADANMSFAIYDMAGRMVGNLLSTACKDGLNQIQFNIAPLSPGNYMMKGIDSRGQLLVSKKFQRL